MLRTNAQRSLSMHILGAWAWPLHSSGHRGSSGTLLSSWSFSLSEGEGVVVPLFDIVRVLLTTTFYLHLPHRLPARRTWNPTNKSREIEPRRSHRSALGGPGPRLRPAKNGLFNLRSIRHSVLPALGLRCSALGCQIWKNTWAQFGSGWEHVGIGLGSFLHRSGELSHPMGALCFQVC